MADNGIYTVFISDAKYNLHFWNRIEKKKIKEENSSRERKRIQKEKHDLRERVSLLLCWAAKEKVHSAFSRYWKRLTAPDLISE